MADDRDRRRLDSDSSGKATVHDEGAEPDVRPGRRSLSGAGHDSPTTNLLAVGQLLAGQYRVLEKLGSGGMGLVYKVEDEKLDRLFAVKVLPPDMAKNAAALKRLTKEAQAAVDLHHPNIMGLNALLNDGETHFLLMEYLDGQDLDAALADRGTLRLDEVLEIARQVCSAMDYAHGRGVVHRDLKPANLLYKTEGDRKVVKVADFGIAHQVRTSVSKLTGQDTSSGTLHYMPPEQLAGRETDARSDQYALAATLYELLRGRPPFEGAGVALIHQVETAQPEPLTKVPDHVNAALLKALAKKPADRFADCGAFLAALERRGATAAVAPVATGAARPSSTPTVVAVLSLLLAAALVGGYSTGLLMPSGALSATPEPTAPAISPSPTAAASPIASPTAVQTPAPAGFPTHNAAATPEAKANGPKPGQPFENSLGMKLVWLVPGTFQMGDGDNGPVHTVRMTRGFWMGTTEVTQSEWEAVMGSNLSDFKGLRRPVEQVSWNDCQDYCRKLTEREQSKGTLPQGTVYRLPTDAEWEYACRAGTTGARYGEVNSVAWYDQSSGKETHDVGQKRANAWGLYDMLGNVWEWCQDGERSYSAGAQTDPVGPSGGSRIMRGGSWGDRASFCRAAYRYHNTPDSRRNCLGCRVVVGAPVRSADSAPTGAASPPSRPPTPVQPAAGYAGRSKAGDVTQNSIGMKLVWIPPGRFTMGSPSDEQGIPAKLEGPQHEVTITRGFWLGQFEVTQAEWEAVMGPSGVRGTRRPVVGVTWDACQVFLQRLTERDGKRYRLPTEAEWEYACRAGTTGKRYGDVDSVAWHSGNSGMQTHEVGQKQPNTWGLYDMLGNVDEWCGDWQGSYQAGAQTDPTGPGSGSARAARGGSWCLVAWHCRAASRGGMMPGSRFASLGFRALRTP